MKKKIKGDCVIENISIARLSSHFVTFHGFVIFNEAFHWPNFGWFWLAEFA